MAAPVIRIDAIKYARHERTAVNNFSRPVDDHDLPMPLDYFVWAIHREGEPPVIVDTGFGEDAAVARGRTITRPVLQGLRDIWKTPLNRQGDEPFSMTLGLYQGDKLDAAAQTAHQRALNEAFLPQLAKRIEDQLRTAQKDNLEFTYEALKSYLMIHQPEHFDAEALKAWITLDWARSRRQGRSGTLPAPVPIIEHPDVRRMLLSMKARVVQLK